MLGVCLYVGSVFVIVIICSFLLLLCFVLLCVLSVCCRFDCVLSICMVCRMWNIVMKGCICMLILDVGFVIMCICLFVCLLVC